MDFEDYILNESVIEMPVILLVVDTLQFGYVISTVSYRKEY